jgi:DNA ligase-1
MPEHPSRRRLIAALACLPAAAQARRDAAPLLLAREAPADIDPRGFLVSEKYDGVRALWDGHRLRSRGGLAIAAPAWFTQRLPALPLDGELWLGRGRFDALSGLVRRAAAADEGAWRAVRYMVFELPGAPGSFSERAARLWQLPGVQAAPQRTLADAAALQRLLAETVEGGGEGLVLHRADAPWTTGRSDALLKLKPLHDAEGLVLGHEPGRGRLEGRLGALRVRTRDGVEFQLGSGLSDALRADPPPVGSLVSYSYRGLTPSGVPRFASFLRVRDPRL